MGAKIEIKGNLGADAELSYTNDKKAFLKLSVYQPHWVSNKDAKADEPKYIDTAGFWIDCTWFDSAAAVAAEHLKKGVAVQIIGDLRLESWTDNTTGEKRSKFRCNAKSLGLMFKRPSDNSQSNGDNQKHSQAKIDHQEPPQATNTLSENDYSDEFDSDDGPF